MNDERREARVSKGDDTDSEEQTEIETVVNRGKSNDLDFVTMSEESAQLLLKLILDTDGELRDREPPDKPSAETGDV